MSRDAERDSTPAFFFNRTEGLMMKYGKICDICQKIAILSTAQCLNCWEAPLKFSSEISVLSESPDLVVAPSVKHCPSISPTRAKTEMVEARA